jgi:hypothetical protein
LANLIFTLCCERPIVDSQTNLLSLIGVIEEIGLSGPQPVFGGIMHIVTLWERSNLLDTKPEKYEFTLKLQAPSGQIVNQVGPMNGVIEGRRHRGFIALQAIPFPEQGRYHWVIETTENGQTRVAAMIPLDVAHLPMPAQYSGKPS